MSENVKWLREIAAGLNVGAYDPVDNLLAEAMNDVLRGQFTSAADEIESLALKLGLLTEENAALIEQLKARAQADPGYGAQRQQVAELESRLHKALKENERLDGIILHANKERCKWTEPVDSLDDCPCAECKPSVCLGTFSAQAPEGTYPAVQERLVEKPTRNSAWDLVNPAGIIKTPE